MGEFQPTPIQLVLHQGHTKKFMQIDCHRNEKIHDLKKRLADKVGDGIAVERMNVIFCGKALTDEQSIEQLELGPMTSLTVTMKIAPNQEDAENDDDCLSWEQIPQFPNEGECEDDANISLLPILELDKVAHNLLAQQQKQQEFSSFFIFCKCCQRMDRAKLRAYCRECQSSAIVFQAGQEPQSWRDVLETNQLRVHCHDCDKERGVNFRFKCIKCNEIGTPLMHLKRNSPLSPNPCAICQELPQICVGLGCEHIACVDCFRAYAEQMLTQNCLSYNANVGYTIQCSVFGCSAHVWDVHTFYLLGTAAYQKYQHSAAHKFFEQHVSTRHTCPSPGCGAAFFIEDSELEGPEPKMFLCPECACMFCRFCDGIGGECKCLEEPQFDSSTSLIRQITKPCPNCSAPTERSGGCAHIYCSRCKADWCFVCGTGWTENCQWDHWFH